MHDSLLPQPLKFLRGKNQWTLVVCLLAFCSGCVGPRKTISTAPVGPAHFIPANNSPVGGLSVYSALDLGMGVPDVGIVYHSDYKIYSFEGKPIRNVHNQVTTYLADPVVVNLSPGRYKVEARAAAFGYVTVPVVIEAGRMTWVYLDGSDLVGGKQTSAKDFVSLPDGLIIGWRAESFGNPK